MLPFSRVLLFAGVATGVVVSFFVTRSGSDISMAQLTPVEREQLRDQLRLRDNEWPHSGVLISPDTAPASKPAAAGWDRFKSGLSPQERQALREQVREMNPEVLLDANGLSESVAVNESYPDGISEPLGNQSAGGGSSR